MREVLQVIYENVMAGVTARCLWLVLKCSEITRGEVRPDLLAWVCEHREERVGSVTEMGEVEQERKAPVKIVGSQHLIPPLTHCVRHLPQRSVSSPNLPVVLFSVTHWIASLFSHKSARLPRLPVTRPTVTHSPSHSVSHSLKSPDLGLAWDTLRQNFCHSRLVWG
jgi:hypothetical protein